MTVEIAIVLLILAAAVVVSALEKLPLDLVAMLVVAALVITGILTPEEGASGFSNPATLTVAGMFILSAGLQKVGAVSALGHLLTTCGRTPSLFMLVIAVTIGAISAFINNTAAVAVFLPLVMGTAEARRFPVSRFLIPLSYAAQFGGVCTLIGTSTNLLVSSMAQQAGLAPFDMFEFARLGLVLFGAGTVYLLVVGRWLLPAHHGKELTQAYQLGEFITELRVLPGSPLIGKTVLQLRLGSQYDVTVLELLRGEHKIWAPVYEPLRENDILIVRGKVKNLMEIRKRLKLAIEPQFQLNDSALEGEDAVLVEALVAPGSRWIGQTLASLDFYRRFNALVLALHRRRQLLREKLANVRLRFGDALLLLVRKTDIPRLRQNENLIVLHEVEQPGRLRRRAPAALLIMAGVVTLAALDVVPILIAAILGCAAMILTRCLTPEEAYQSVDWKIIVLLGGILPLGLALEKTGAAKLIADQALHAAGQANPTLALAILYLLTAVLTSLMSNNATAVLLAPIAISVARDMGVDPKPFLMAVAFAASTSFATPVGYQTNLMVYSAGNYRFRDFLRVGIPLNLIFWALAVYYIPRLWPFHPVVVSP